MHKKQIYVVRDGLGEGVECGVVTNQWEDLNKQGGQRL